MRNEHLKLRRLSMPRLAVPTRPLSSMPVPPPPQSQASHPLPPHSLCHRALNPACRRSVLRNARCCVMRGEASHTVARMRVPRCPVPRLDTPAAPATEPTCAMRDARCDIDLDTRADADDSAISGPANRPHPPTSSGPPSWFPDWRHPGHGVREEQPRWVQMEQVGVEDRLPGRPPAGRPTQTRPAGHRVTGATDGDGGQMLDRQGLAPPSTRSMDEVPHPAVGGVRRDAGLSGGVL